jgi:hypothetical protein
MANSCMGENIDKERQGDHKCKVMSKLMHGRKWIKRGRENIQDETTYPLGAVSDNF